MNRKPSPVVRFLDPSAKPFWAKKAATQVYAKVTIAVPTAPKEEHIWEATDGDRYIDISDQLSPDYKPPGILWRLIRLIGKLIFDPWHQAKKAVNHILSYIAYNEIEGKWKLRIVTSLLTSAVAFLFTISTAAVGFFFVNVNNYFAETEIQLMFPEYEWANLSLRGILLMLPAVPFALCLLIQTGKELFGE